MSNSPPPTNMLDDDAITTIDRHIETESNDNLTADTIPRKKKKRFVRRWSSCFKNENKQDALYEEFSG